MSGWRIAWIAFYLRHKYTLLEGIPRSIHKNAGARHHGSLDQTLSCLRRARKLPGFAD